MHDAYEDLRHVAQLRLKLCQLHQNQEDPEVRQAINAANQAIGELTALLYKQASPNSRCRRSYCICIRSDGAPYKGLASI